MNVVIKMCLFENLLLHFIKMSNEQTMLTSYSRIGTGDGMWVYGYDPKTKQQFSQ